MKWIKRILLAIFAMGLLLALYVGSIFWGQYQRHFEAKKYAGKIRETATPQVFLLKDNLYIDYLDQKRSLHIYLPPNYEADTLERFPVMYMLDGDALFDDMVLGGPEWQVDEVLNEDVANGGKGAIVIGIPSLDNRSVEYKPFPDPKNRDEKLVEGDKFAKWLTHDLKTWVDSTFRTQVGPSSHLIGRASLGGLMAYYILMTYPETFESALVMSPSFWVNPKVYELHKNISDLNRFKIYINVGGKEGWEMKSNAKKMYNTLAKAGMNKENLRFETIKGERHWHMAWRKGFRSAYPWVFR